MPFVGARNIDGDTKELLGKYDQVMEKLQRRERPRPGLIAHYCMETDTGIRVVNCYETEEQLRAAYEATDFRDALREAGIDEQPPQIADLHADGVVLRWVAAQAIEQSHQRFRRHEPVAPRPRTGGRPRR